MPCRCSDVLSTPSSIITSVAEFVCGIFGIPPNYSEFNSSGNLIHHGNARVRRYTWIPVNAIRATGVKPATIKLNGNGFIVASFADNQEQNVQADLMIPEDADRTEPIVVCVGWSSPATNKVCDWELTHLITKVGESTDVAGITTQQYGNSSSVANGLVRTPVWSYDAGDDDICIHLILERDGNDPNDTLSDVAELHGIALEYISDKRGIPLG